MKSPTSGLNTTRSISRSTWMQTATFHPGLGMVHIIFQLENPSWLPLIDNSAPGWAGSTETEKSLQGKIQPHPHCFNKGFLLGPGVIKSFQLDLRRQCAQSRQFIRRKELSRQGGKLCLRADLLDIHPHFSLKCKHAGDLVLAFRQVERYPAGRDGKLPIRV